MAHLAAYQPRAAEHGVLYRVIDEHLETFLDAAAQHADGQRLPKFVEQEFRDFLTCGVLDGVFTDGADGALRFRPLSPPTDEEVGAVLATIYVRVCRLLRRQGFDVTAADLSRPDPVAEESPLLAGISSASIEGRIALGPCAGRRVWRVGEEPETPWVLSSSPRHAHIAGFDLHANVAVPAADRGRLEQLCRLCGAPHKRHRCSRASRA